MFSWIMQTGLAFWCQGFCDIVLYGFAGMNTALQYLLRLEVLPFSFASDFNYVT